MKITKLGHCCLLLETKSKRILTDPGMFTAEAHGKLEDIDYILITHEHEDHFHIESIKALLIKNPQAKIYSNNSVSALLAAEQIEHDQVNHKDSIMLGDISLVGLGEKHAQMHSSIPQSDNLGYFIGEKLWYPGDSYTDIREYLSAGIAGVPTKVDVLALPVSGPWMKIADAIDYALMLKPNFAFPVHDGIRFGTAHRLPGIILPKNGIEFVPMIEGDEKEF